MAKIKFSDECQAGEIPTYEFEKDEIFKDDFLEVENLLNYREGNIIVCFQSWRELKYEKEHPSIYVTRDAEEANDYFKFYSKRIDCKDVDFSFFCFDTYEEAFKYCIDLKEGL